MSKWLSRSASCLPVRSDLGRRGFFFQHGAAALLGGALPLAVKQAIAADGNAATDGSLYARLKASSLMILVDGQQRGSGTLIQADGFAITAAHVIHQAARSGDHHIDPAP